MKKWLPTIGMVVLYSLLYLAALVYTVFHSKQGNLALGILDCAAIFVAYQVLARIHEPHQRITENQRGRYTLWVAIVLLVSAVIHLFGTFMPTPDLQLMFAFGPIVLIGFLSLSRWLDSGARMNKQRRI